MSKKIITLIIVIIIVILLFFGISYLSKKNPEQTGEVKKAEEGTNFLADILNFGNKNIVDPVVDLVDSIGGGEGDGDEEEDPTIKNKLNKISSMPVSGYGINLKEVYEYVPDVDPTTVDPKEKIKVEAPKTEFIEVLRYADKETGNIYESDLEEIKERKFSNTIIPRAYESLFSKNNIIFRYLNPANNIVTFLGEIPKEILGGDGGENNNEIFGSFLPENIKDISISPNTEKVFYLSNTKNGVVGNIINIKNEKISVFDSSFSEWTSFWPNNDILTLTTKASGFVDGFSYLLNPNSREFNKIIGNIKGLTTLLSPNSNTLLYSDSNLSLNLLDISSGETRPLKMRTHSEKCVWSGDSVTLYCAIPKNIEGGLVYPDAWYQGEANYNDAIWSINTYNGARNKILDPNTIYENEALDIVNLKLDKNEKTLFFTNKADSYLWALDLN